MATPRALHLSCSFPRPHASLRRRLDRRGALLGAALALALAGACRRTPVPAVDAEGVARRDVFRSTVSASGEIVAVRYADIGSSVMGRVVELNVREGESVRAGQLLARIDPVPARSDAEAAVAQVRAIDADERAAQAQADQAARAVTRARDLHAQGLLARADLDAAQAAFDTTRAQRDAAGRRGAQARAQLVRAQDTLGKTEIRAPLGGVVSRLQVRAGEMVVIGLQNQPGTTLMTLSDLSALDAEVKVAEADVLRVKLGQKARVTLEAMPGREFDGEVVEVGASALPVVGTGAAAREFRVVVRLASPDPGLRPGLTCDAEIVASETRGALTVPLQAVVLRDAGGRERTGVFVLDDARVRFTPVEAGAIGGLEIEVRGVQAGQPVVVGPFQTLRELKDGARVRVNQRN